MRAFRPSTTFAVATLAMAGLVIGAALGGCSSAVHRASGGGGAVAGSTSSSTSSSTSTSTTTTVDPGTLPQTAALPGQSDPAFQARVQAVWAAVDDGNPAEGLSAFFPLSAYIQVKAISDPVHDYQTRLIPNFDQDVQALHSQVVGYSGPAGPASPSFVSVTVPAAAEWIRPGVEYNKGSYWRVYGTMVTYTAGGQRHTFEIHSLISWRGEWYVVHLGPIR